MDIVELLRGRRSIRRFKQEHIEIGILKTFVDCARLAPSGGNLQPLEYLIVIDGNQCRNVFEKLNWAAYIQPAGDPPEGSEPTAYIVVLVNRNIKKSRYEYDVGAAVENILIAASAAGIGSCWIRNFKPEELCEVLDLPDNIHPDTVIALGYPDEGSVVEEYVDSIRYWKDENGSLHVPKRSLQSILHIDRYQQ